MQISKIIKTKDRKLGNEWTDWNGSLGKEQADSTTGKRVFIGVLAIALIFFGAAGYFIWFMIQPRLELLYDYLPLIVGLILLFWWAMIAVWFGMMVLSLITGKDYLLKLGKKEISITFLIPIALNFGQKLGISRDRMGNSLVKVSNLLIKYRIKKVRPEKIVIILPRCLKKEFIDEIKLRTDKLNIAVHIVSGGSKAREIIVKAKPDAVIGVACERDLLSGIQEFLDKIPVLAIPNKRPEGPCKNTIIDLDEFDATLKTLL